MTGILDGRRMLGLEEVLAEARRNSLSRDNPLLADLPEFFTSFRDHQRVAVREILTAYEEGVDCVVLDAPTGCLAGDTKIIVNRGGNARQFEIRQLVHSFNGGVSSGINGDRRWNLSIPTSVACVDDEGYMRKGELKSAWCSGVKTTCTVKTGAHTIRATFTHPFLTPDGFMALGGLTVGSQVAVQGTQKKGTKPIKKHYRYTNRLYRHPHATNKRSYTKCEGWRVPLHRLVIEAEMNGMALDKYVALLRQPEPYTHPMFIVLDPKFAVHHKDGDSLNNNRSNLEVLTHHEHWSQEGQEKTWRNVARRIEFVPIESITYHGEEMTYDLEMAQEPHNFIANGYAVHNSGKTLIGETVRRLLPSVTGGGVGQCSYICSSKALQDQFIKDYPYAKVLKGRSNYATESYPERFGGKDGLSAGDCTKSPGNDESCQWCSSVHLCPYERAKHAALRSGLAVLNTSYFLSECNGPGRFSRGGLVIADECLAAGTQISTPSGTRNIEDIKVGDVIWGEENGRVVKTIVERVMVNEGTTLSLNGLEITGNHPILTARGYVPASQISPLDKIAVTGLNPSHGTTLRMVPTALPGEDPTVFQRKAAEVLWKSMFRGMEEESAEKTPQGDLRILWSGICNHEGDSTILQPTLRKQVELASESREDDGLGCGSDDGGKEDARGSGKVKGVAKESRQSDIQPCRQAESPRDPISPGIRSPEWRQWYRTYGATENVSGSFGVADGGCSENGQATPTLLQDRHSQSGAVDRCGGGRGESSQPEGEGSGQAKDGVFGKSGLGGFEGTEQVGVGELAVGSGKDSSVRVYNLSTGTHNYIANGIVVHNCDSLEGELMSHVEVRVSERRLKGYGLGVPRYVTKEEAWIEWAEKAHHQVSQRRPRLDPTDVKSVREAKRHDILVARLKDLQVGLEGGGWIYTGDKTSVSFKPITVDKVGEAKLWAHGDKWLLMSATVISADELVESLGFPEDKEWRLVKCPSTFPVENRKVFIHPVASMTYKERDSAWPKITEAVVRIASEGRGTTGKMLIHSSSYALTEHIADELVVANLRRPIFSYSCAADKESSFVEWQKSDDGIMVAPSLDRGIDLPGDACRTMIIVKVPFLSLKDKQVSARLYGGGRAGKLWYQVNAIRTIVQMCGRAVRSEDDFCTTWIIDSQFVSNLWGNSKRLFPEWWKEGLVWQRMGV